MSNNNDTRQIFLPNNTSFSGMIRPGADNINQVRYKMPPPQIPVGNMNQQRPILRGQNQSLNQQRASSLQIGNQSSVLNTNNIK